MKVSYLFLIGALFAMGYNILSDVIRDHWGVDNGYSYASVFLIITILILWYKIDEKLNKTYQVTRWN